MSWQKCRDASDLTGLNQPETWDKAGPLARRRLAAAEQSQEEEEEEEDLVIPSGWAGEGSMRKAKKERLGLRGRGLWLCGLVLARGRQGSGHTGKARGAGSTKFCLVTAMVLTVSSRPPLRAVLAGVAHSRPHQERDVHLCIPAGFSPWIQFLVPSLSSCLRALSW